MGLIKDSEQVAGIRKSCSLLAETFKHIEPYVVPGMTGLELDKIARDYIRKLGAVPSFLNYNRFPAGLCISINDEVIHGIPDKRTFKEGDLVSVDCGINLGGYFSDSAYTFALGSVSDAEQRLLAATSESLMLGISEVKPGNRIKDISKAIYTRVRGEGFGVVRSFCGHGVGLAIHEEPQVPNYPSSGPNPRLRPGMVLAIEPMVNLGTDDVRILDDDWTVVTRDGSKSAHFEHTVLVTEDGYDILTLWK